MADEKQDVQQEVKKPNPALRVASPSVQLKLKFGTLSGDKTFSYNYALGASDEEDVKTLMQAMITNGSIFKYPPLVAREAWVETKTIMEFDIDS